MLTGHKGNVLLEDVEPGQQVFLNVSFALDHSFMFLTEPSHLESALQINQLMESKTVNKDAMVAFYCNMRKQLSESSAKHLLYKARGSDAEAQQLHMLLNGYEMLAVVRQLCFDEPIPLIDVSKFLFNQDIEDIKNR